MQLYRWICRLHDRKVSHAGNLFWACQCLSIPDPNTLTSKEVMLNKEECVWCLTLLKELAPKLQNEHWRSHLDEARLCGDNEAVQANRDPLIRIDTKALACVTAHYQP